jgi:hypothetical protein
MVVLKFCKKYFTFILLLFQLYICGPYRFFKFTFNMNFYFYFFSTCVIESREDATGFELKREQIMIDIDFSKIKKIIVIRFYSTRTVLW